MDATKRHTRRSHPNLSVLTVAPLTPNFPLPATEGDENIQTASEQRHRPQTPKSYIEPRSLPQTPSLLSRSNSRTRHRPTSRSGIAIADLETATERLKDVTVTLSPHTSKGAHHRSSSSKGARALDDSGWILHTASALTTSTAESKGQAWLATRTSSTSLVDPHMSMHIERFEAYPGDDEVSPISHRRTSRPGSRFGSRATSRRGSRVGIMTPAGVKSPEDRSEVANYFEGMGVEFVDGADDEESVEDESEMKRLVWGRVGGWVDWAVGWMDFRELEEADDPDEKQDEEEDAGEDETGSPSQGRKSALKGAARRRPRRQKRLHYEITENIDNIPPAPENVGVLGDAAWLFGLARSALG